MVVQSHMLRRGELPGIVVRTGSGEKRIRRMFRVRLQDLEAWEQQRLTGGGKGRR